MNGIPLIGEVADAAALAFESEAQAAQVIDTALQGGNLSLAWKLAGINMAGAVVGAVGGPTARLAAKGAAKGVAEGAAKGATQGTTKGAAKGGGKGVAEREKPLDIAKGYIIGTTINRPTEMLKTPVLAGLHYEEVRLDKEKKKGEIRKNLEAAGGVPLGKQFIPKAIADNFEADTKENLRHVRGRRK